MEVTHIRDNENVGAIGLIVVDDDGNEHEVGMKYDGEILHHQNEAIADDPSDRTSTEDEMFSQVRRFARYHVYDKLGYDTVPNRENPDRIAATLVAFTRLDEESFEEYFEAYERQFREYYEPSVDGPIAPEQYVDRDEFRLYIVDVYLEEGLEEITSVSEEYISELETIADEIHNKIPSGGSFRQQLAEVGSVLSGEEAPETPEIPDFTIEAVSNVGMLYNTDTNGKEQVGGESPVDREPDARFGLPPAPIDNRAQFRAVLQKHLLCQIRDFYVGIGTEPPAPFRLLGHGHSKYAQRYRNVEMYPNYVDPDADIPGYQAQ